MVKIVITLKARKDLDSIKKYIALDNTEKADSFSEELLKSCIDTLSLFPLSNPLYNKPLSIRRFIYYDYNIYYRFDKEEQTVNILHILNSALLKNTTLKNL